MSSSSIVAEALWKDHFNYGKLFWENIASICNNMITYKCGMIILINIIEDYWRSCTVVCTRSDIISEMVQDNDIVTIDILLFQHEA